MKDNKLTAKWNKKEKDLVVKYPLGCGTNCDMAYLLYDVFNKAFIEEMKDRGYDLTSLKFEIAVDPNSKTFKDRFPTLARELKEDGKV